MSIKLKLSIPALLGLVLIVFFMEYVWKPYQLDKEKEFYRLHSIELIKASETGLSQPLLKKDFGTLFSNLEQLELINQGRWYNLKLFKQNDQKLYPIVPSENRHSGKDFLQVIYPLEVQNITIGKITLDIDWHTPKERIISEIDSIRNMTMAIMILIILITTLSQYQIIYRPIKKLVRATKSVQQGSLYPALPEATTDEFGELTIAFGDMLDELSIKKSALDSHAMVSSTDQDGIITQVNNRFTTFTQYKFQELVGKSYSVLKSDAHPSTLYRSIWQTISRGKTWSGEICNKKKNGELYWVNTSIIPCLDPIGIPYRFICIQTDISIQKAEIAKRIEVEKNLSKERQRLEYILQGTNVGTWEWDVRSGITCFNEQWANLIGYSLQELGPTTIDTWSKYAHPEDLLKSGKLLEQHFRCETDYYECEVRMKHRDGHWIWVLDRGKVFSWTKDGKPILMCGTHQDISDRKITEEKILHLATHDNLTQLPNLQVVHDRVDTAIKQAKRNDTLLALLFIDLDGFKSVNDTAGHYAGNLLLVETAKRLLSCVRESDTVARIGGDEFLILLQNLKAEEEASDVAQKVVRSVNQPIDIDSNTMKVGASVGISVYPFNGDNFETLLKVSDTAMYSAKKVGKHGFVMA
jgi:diguanylate cyclase (GGDEF)-like protein/PAS domain S-box-containing protein